MYMQLFNVANTTNNSSLKNPLQTDVILPIVLLSASEGPHVVLGDKVVFDVLPCSHSL
jgi:hypothetical protein